MKQLRSPLLCASPVRALLESWLACAVLLLGVLPLALDATPLARSLFLVLAPLVCAVIAGLRLRLTTGSVGRVALTETGFALSLALGVLALVFVPLWALNQLDAIRASFAGTTATMVFILLAAPETLCVRALVWTWRRWNQLRRHRYVWALTHANLTVAAWFVGLALLGALVYFVNRLGNDIWQIPAGSVFAQTVFWLSMTILFASVLFSVGLVLFLPPAALFSFSIARGLTSRLETLAAATRALRKGDLSTRVEVAGEDEIAAVQADFNAMAADLEQSVQALQAEKDKVWALMEARRDLFAGVSHELRNPVATILGYSGSLRRDWQDRPAQEVQRDLETIQYEATRMQAILNDLLTVSQADAGRLSLAPQAVDVCALARRLVETFGGLAWSSQRVHVTLSAPAEPVFALVDPLRLEQVLVNLLQNALRHTSPGGLVACDVHRCVESVRIEVEDTGEGIAPEDLAHIWEKYYQSASPKRRAAAGLGLGLALVKELTEAMGGAVTVESDAGQGSLFRVTLPACPPAERQ